MAGRRVAVAGRRAKSGAQKTARRAAKSSAASDMSSSLSPLAPKTFPALPPLAGVRLAAGAAGIRYRDRADTMLAVLAPGTQVAGLFTTSRTASAPVEWCRAQLPRKTARALVANSGNANAFTGAEGREAVRAMAGSAAAVLDCHTHEIFIASTGVIGEPLPVERIARILPTLAESGAAAGWREAAQAIMTTDTFPKLATTRARIDDFRVTINGIAKGSGMIAPDMATLLAFVFTDANLPSPVLQELLNAGAQNSFQAITVDGDTSTSDTLLLFATGKGAPHPPIAKASDRRLADFREKLNALLLDLALQVVRDGEGARKLIRIDVNGAETDTAARRIAVSIANSPLVKTAVAGGDANWGRIVMAVGKAGEVADRDRLRITFGDVTVAEHGRRAEAYREAAASRAVAGPEVRIGVDLGIGDGRARVWTCDLTEGYIRINGSYRS